MSATLKPKKQINPIILILIIILGLIFILSLLPFIILLSPAVCIYFIFHSLFNLINRINKRNNIVKLKLNLND